MKIKWSKILHFLSVVFMLWGAGALVYAWRATKAGGLFRGMTEGHLFNDAQTLLLIAIVLALGTIHHQNIEKH